MALLDGQCRIGTGLGFAVFEIDYPLTVVALLPIRSMMFKASMNQEHINRDKNIYRSFSFEEVSVNCTPSNLK